MEVKKNAVATATMQDYLKALYKLEKAQTPVPTSATARPPGSFAATVSKLWVSACSAFVLVTLVLMAIRPPRS